MSDAAWDEEPGQDVANKAWGRMLAWRTAAYLAAALGIVILMVVEYVFLVAAFWYLPKLLAAPLAFWQGCELAEALYSARGQKAERAKQEPSAEGERVLESLQRPIGRGWWAVGWRSRDFRRGLAARIIYSACFGLVIERWTGFPGWAAACLFCAWAIWAGNLVRVAQKRAGGVAAFGDPRPPRDTPEI